jgi:transposase
MGEGRAHFIMDNLLAAKRCVPMLVVMAEIHALDPRVPANIELLPLPAYSPELNPAEWFGRVVKAPTVNRLYASLRALEDHLISIAKRWSHPEKVCRLIHQWMRDQVNIIAPA